MKQLLIIISILLFADSNFAQETYVDSLFVKANESYSNQEFLTSIDLYMEIVNQGYKSPELFMNIGNAYFKIGQHTRAILFYEKALSLDPKSDDIAFNLQKAQAYTIDKIEMIPEFFLVTWFRRFISLFSSNLWAVLGIGSFVITLIFFLLFFNNTVRSKKTIYFSLGVILFVVSVLSYSFAIKTKNYVENADQAIVMVSTVTVKGAPDLDGVNVFIIHEGTKVTILRSIDEWYEIKLADGKQGWLLQSDVEKI